MCKKTNKGRNNTSKSRKKQSAWGKRELLVTVNIGSRHHQTSADERKNL